jgi:P27 family predicted phage terminase small subunit
MRGRRPIPTHLKLLRGNPGKRPLPANEVQPTVPEHVPCPPPFLEDHAREEWHRIAAQLCRLNLLTIVDVNPLAAYCQAYARWRLAEEALAEMRKRDPMLNALMLRAKNGTPMQNPLVLTSARAAADMVRYAVEFGLTPSARARIAAGPNGDDGGGKFSGLIG